MCIKYFICVYARITAKTKNKQVSLENTRSLAGLWTFLENRMKL